VKPKPKAKSQKPKAKWARKWEILAPKCMQNTDFSSKMQQIARKAAPGWKTKKKNSQLNWSQHNRSETCLQLAFLASQLLNLFLLLRNLIPNDGNLQGAGYKGCKRLQKIAKDCKMSFNGS
jgi:hypothetical protein